MEIGDKVKVIDLFDYDEEDTDLKIGDVGTVKIIDDSGINIIYDILFENNTIKENARNGNSDGTYTFFSYEVEKVEEK